MRNNFILFITALMLLFLTACTDNEKQNISPETVVQTNQPEEAKPTATEQVILPLDGKIICVDAGHGINSSNEKEAIAPNSAEKKRAFVSGTRGKNQTEEELNLSVALKLEEKLKALGAEVHMTRKTHETTLSNIGRAKFANELSADISVKLHADGIENSSARGVSMLVPANKHVKSEVYSESLKIGEIILDEVVKQTGAPDRGVVKRSDMTGFNWSEVPVVLLEMGFMTNPEEDALMETDDYQNKIVEGIANGILKYFEQ